ncbi:MAG: HAD-IIIA family hydrolase [Methylococcaceae bacterium]|nr:HAD-IIIA family hydrolase [Methylococcaceae bacterium]
MDIHERAARIRLVIFDVDGVLTDGKLFFDERGTEYKGFHSRDGLGIALLRQTGVEVAVISGRNSKSVTQRMAGLGIERVFQGQQNKLAAFDRLCRDLNLAPEQVAHVGDDLLDLSLMRRVGLAVAVADAHPAILPFAHWRTVNPGGLGAAREVCDLIMDAQGHLQGIIESHY